MNRMKIVRNFLFAFNQRCLLYISGLPDQGSLDLHHFFGFFQSDKVILLLNIIDFRIHPFKADH